MRFSVSIITIILALLLSFGLSSCSPSFPPSDDIAFKLLEAVGDMPPCSQFVKDGEIYKSGYISPEDFAYLYTGEKTMLPEWELIDDFRLILSDSTDFFEIHVIRTVDCTVTDEVVKLLEKRKRLLLLHIKEEGDYPIKEPCLFVSGRYAVLLATERNEELVKVLKKLV